MLYDPKWEKKVEAKPYTLPALIAWLEKQPPEQHYDFNNYDGACLLDQYVTSVTGKPSTPTPDTHWKTCGDGNGYTRIARRRPWTFGAALERARAELALGTNDCMRPISKD